MLHKHTPLPWEQHTPLHKNITNRKNATGQKDVQEPRRQTMSVYQTGASDGSCTDQEREGESRHWNLYHLCSSFQRENSKTVSLPTLAVSSNA
jgi:hypothetical protein